MNGNRLNSDWNDDILKLLSKEELDNFRKIKFEKGEIIYAQKIRFMILLKGKLKISFLCGAREFVLKKKKKGSFVVQSSDATIEALESSEVVEINVADVRRLFGNEAFSMSMMNALLRNILAQRKLIYDMYFRTSEDRLRSFLIELAKEREERVINLPFTISNLSMLCGSPRQNISTAFNKFVKNGEIEKVGKQKYKINFAES